MKFGVYEDPANPANSICEQVAVAVSLVGAKTLAHSLMEVIARFEKDNNIVIPFSPEKVAEIKSSVAAVVADVGKRT